MIIKPRDAALLGTKRIDMSDVIANFKKTRDNSGNDFFVYNNVGVWDCFNCI